MERIINLELIEYLLHHGLISKCQHSFLHKHSTCTKTYWNQLTVGLLIFIIITQLILYIYINFKKAFDSVSHPKLISKLTSYGICGDLLDWLKAFFTNRTQAVKMLNCLSKTLQLPV